MLCSSFVSLAGSFTAGHLCSIREARSPPEQARSATVVLEEVTVNLQDFAYPPKASATAAIRASLLSNLREIGSQFCSLTIGAGTRSMNHIDTRYRSEEHTSELQSHSFISYAVFCLKKK